MASANEDSLRVAVRRLSRTSWVLVGGFALLASVEAARFFLPDQPFLLVTLAESWRDPDRSLVNNDSLRDAGILLIAFFLVSIVLSRVALRVAGRPSRYRLDGARTIPMNSQAAADLVARAFRNLLALGFTTTRLPEGGEIWSATATKSSSMQKLDLRRVGQTIEFNFANESLEIRHRFATTITRQERGEAVWQEWILERLAAGVPLDDPPRLISDTAVNVLAGSAVLAVLGGAFHFLPEGAREQWALGFELLIVFSAIMLVAALILAMSERRFVRGLSLLAPAIFLGSFGITLFVLRPDDWQRLPWRTTSDPQVLVKAGHAAARRDRSRNCRGRFMTAREIAACEARCAIQKRLIARGSEAAPLLVDRLEGDIFDEWPRAMLERIGEPAGPALLAGLIDPRIDVRRRSLWALGSLDRTPERLAAVRRCFVDADAVVRASAIEYFSSRQYISNMFSPPPGGPRSNDLGPDLVRLLHDPDRGVRLSAERVAGYQKCRETVSRLLELIDDPDSSVSDGALAALAAIGDPAAVPAFAKRFDRNVKSGGNGLLSFGSAGIEALLDRTDNPRALELLRRAQGALDLPHTTVLRLIALVRDPDPARRRAALVLLARQARPEVAANAFAGLEDADARIRAATASELFVRGLATLEHARLALRDGDEEATRELLWSVIRKKRPRELAPEIATLVSGVRFDRAMDALAEIDSGLWAATAEAKSRSAIPAVREGSIRPRYGDPSPLATATLLRLLDDSEKSVRAAAASALHDRQTPEVIAALLRCLATESDPRVRATIVCSLGWLEARDAVPALIEIAAHAKQLDTFHDELEAQAIVALGAIGDRRAVPVLRAILDRAVTRTDRSTVYVVAPALARLGEKDVIPWLRHAMRRPGIIACGTDGCTNPEAIDATLALGKLGEEGATELLAVLEEDNAREAAARALGETGSPRALPRLLELLKEPWHRMRSSAARGLGMLGDKRAIEPLLAAIDDRSLDVVENAAWALERLTGQAFGIGEIRFHWDGPDPAEMEATKTRVKAWAGGRPR